jgi:hypothetical protein
MSDPAGLTLDEALERIEAGWHVKPGFLELLERDYDSAQRKRYLRTEHEWIARCCEHRSIETIF